MKNVVFLLFHILYLFNMIHYLYTAQANPWNESQDKPFRDKFAM